MAEASGGLASLLPDPLLLPGCGRIVTPQFEVELSTELVVVRQATPVERPVTLRGEHGAVRLMVVLAVREPRGGR